MRRDTPDAAVTTGQHAAHACLATGEQIAVTADVRCTQTTLWARGTVTVDGFRVADRTWNLPLTHRYEPKEAHGDD